MTIAEFAIIAFFLLYGVDYFFPFPQSRLVLAIASIVAGVALLIGR